MIFRLNGRFLGNRGLPHSSHFSDHQVIQNPQKEPGMRSEVSIILEGLRPCGLTGNLETAVDRFSTLRSPHTG